MEEAQLSGRLSKTPFPEVLGEVSRRKNSGVLHLKFEDLDKQIYFLEGKLIFARSSDPDERLGPFLLRQNKITYPQLMKCDLKVTPGARLGSILVKEGYLQSNDLYQAVVDQLREIVYQIFDWPDGSFELHPDEKPAQETITLNISSEDVIVSGISRVSRWSVIQERVGSLDSVFRKKEGWSRILRKVSLTREMEALIDLLDQPRTLAELFQYSPLGSFETCRLVWAFQTIDVIEQILVAPRWEESDKTGPFNAVQDAPAAEAASPTLKLTVRSIPDAATQLSTPETALSLSRVEPPDTLTMPAPSSSPAVDPYITNPGIELSFADLADLTDAADEAYYPSERTVEIPKRWEDHVARDVKEFNELHRYLFEMVRLELGSGASNFLSKVFRRISARFPLVFDGVALDEGGELEEHTLITAIDANLAKKYQEAFNSLLQEERTAVRLFLDRKRVDSIEAGLKRLMEHRKLTVA